MSEDIKKDELFGEEAADAAAEAADAAEEAAEEAVDAAGEAAEDVADAVDEVAEEAVDAFDEAADAAEDAVDTADEALNEELETLRDTFQEKYDETVEEAAGPVIQELESHSGDAEEESEEADEAAAATDAPAKKKKRKGLKAFIIIVIILAVLLFGMLIAYFVLSVSNPNFNSLVSSLASASTAETYDEKMDAYEQALSYCDGDSTSQNAMKEYVVDEMLKAAYQEKGFDVAYSMMKEQLTDDQIAASKSKTVKKIKNVIAAADEIADGSLDAVFAAFAENPDASAEDVAKTFSVPSEIEEGITAAFADELKAVAQLKDGADIASATAAIESLQSAYAALTGAGADKEDLAEKMAVSLYKNGCAFAAMTVSNALADAEAEPLNQEYKDMLADVGDFSGVDVSIYDLAVKAEKESRDDYAALVAESCEVSEGKASLLGQLVGFCTEGILAEQEKNYSLASSAFANTFSVVDALAISDNTLLFRAASAALESSNLSQLQNYDALLTDAFAASLSKKDAAQVERIHQIYNALNNASSIFSNYYMNYAYYGQAIDYKAACDELDALIKDDSNNYDKGFVAYCKYFAAVYTDNKADFRTYVDEMKAQMPDLKSVYGYYEIDLLKEEGKYDEAKTVAESILESNIGDDYAMATVAFVKRTKGDVEGALETAVKGIELSGSETFCANEAAIDYMLTGNFDDAFRYLKNMYQSSPSIESCDMLLIFNALYNGDNKEIKDEAAALVEEIDQTYASYQVTSLSDTTAIINGEKTLEDVFCAGIYSLQNDEATAEAEAEEAAEAAEENTADSQN